MCHVLGKKVGKEVQFMKRLHLFSISRLTILGVAIIPPESIMAQGGGASLRLICRKDNPKPAYTFRGQAAEPGARKSPLNRREPRLAAGRLQR